MKDTYTYKIGNNLYLNLTNRCTNRCTFCVRNGKETFEGYSLWLKGGEPTAEQVISEIGDPKAYGEVVFCGFGEPTLKLEELKEICAYIRGRGGKTRLNTNGHASAYYGRNVAAELAGLFDGVNVSLNAPTREEYDAICRPQIENAYAAMLGFARAGKAAGLNIWFSVVDCIGQEKVEACRRIAEDVGIPLRVRPMIEK